MEMALGVLTALVATFMGLLVTTPLFVPLLVNKPREGRKSGFHLFTYIEEGKVKIVVRGDVVVRMIMLYAGHKFGRVYTTQDREHWEINETPGQMESPLAGINWLVKPWAWYVYVTTGAVLVGLYPFWRVREYPLERTEIKRDESQGSDNLRLTVIRDISDHLRAREFLYPFRVAKADTADKISVNVVLVITAKVINPHKAAFAVDRWDYQLVNLATTAVTNFTRTRNLDAVLTAKDTSEAQALNNAIMQIREDEIKYGIEITGVEIIDISPNLSEEEASKLYSEALSKSVGKATIVDGESRAQALRALNEANREGGEYAVETLRTEALVRASEAARGGTVLLPIGNGGRDAVNSAILAELRKLNQSEEENE